jgi:hypothetical protein
MLIQCKRCTHIKVTGHRCGSPALRGEHFCYFHARMIKGVRSSSAPCRSPCATPATFTSDATAAAWCARCPTGTASGWSNTARPRSLRRSLHRRLTSTLSALIPRQQRKTRQQRKISRARPLRTSPHSFTPRPTTPLEPVIPNLYLVIPNAARDLHFPIPQALQTLVIPNLCLVIPSAARHLQYQQASAQPATRNLQPRRSPPAKPASGANSAACSAPSPAPVMGMSPT